MGWIADFFRFWWGLFYWNSRKTWFHLNPSKRRCPCQSPSDSGKAYETICEASGYWNKSHRFKRVCPLLVQTGEGWRCSVDTRDVRPFWKLAAAYYGGALLSIYLCLALTAFGALRFAGYPVGLGTVIWPGKWHEFGKAKAQFFFTKGSAALARGDYREGTMALNLAYQLDPSHYSTGLLLARFATLLQPEQCDLLFQDLMVRHPEEAKNTAEHWMRSALARGSFAAMRNLALERLASGDKPSSPWIHALLFSTRLLRDDASLRSFLGRPEGAEWKTLIETELIIRSGDKAKAEQRLTQIWYPKISYAAYYQTRQLLALGFADDALLMSGTYQDIMPGSDRVAVILGALAIKGERARLLREAENLIGRRNSSCTAIELLSVHLVHYPDSNLFALIMDHVKEMPLPRDDVGDRAYLTLFFAAGAMHDTAAMAYIQVRLKERSGGSLISLSAAVEFFTDSHSLLRLESFLPVLPVPMDMAYALHERYASGALRLSPKNP